MAWFDKEVSHEDSIWFTYNRVASFSFISTAYAERYVVVNGQRLSIVEIQYLERLHCGPVPNGRYWINLQNGMWGYEGHPRPQGHIADNCRHPQRRPSLSERGMLFSPSDWIR